MHTGKCLRIALITRDRTQSWLAEKLEVNQQAISNLCHRESMNMKTLEKISVFLDYKPSEFVALGEEE